MSKQKQDTENGHEETTSGQKTYETYYEDDKGSKSWTFNPAEAVSGVLGGLRDSVLKTLPVEVTEHLVRSEKELIKAGIALAENQMRHADDTLNRAKDLNKEEKEKEPA